MNRIWTAITCGFLALGLIELRQSPAVAQDTTVWLVRHADRKDGSGNSDLSKDGFKRADDLAALLKDKGIKTIITSKKVRTINTAKPLEDAARGVVVLRLDNSADVVAAVKKSQPNTLVVYHSETLLPIIKDLGGPIGLKKFSCWQYDRIFTMKADGSNFKESKYGALSKKQICP